MMTKPPISKAHEQLNQIRRWLKSNPHYFRPTHLVLLRSVIEDVATPEHVETLQGYMREWMLSDAEAEAQKATTDEAIRQAEAERQGVPDPSYPLPETQDRAAQPSLMQDRLPAPSTQPAEST